MTVVTFDSGQSRYAAPELAGERIGGGQKQRSTTVKGHLTTTALAVLTLALLGAVVTLQLTVHDPAHVLLTAVACWGLLSLPVGLLVGHAALGGGADSGEDD